MVPTGVSPAALLRREIAERNVAFVAAHKPPHALSYGEQPVVCYEPFDGGHGNFLPQTYRAIVNHPEWAKRLKKAHTSARRALPRNERGFWAELDSCMSSDALLMNCFCYPGALSPAVRSLLGVEDDCQPEFGVKARVPLASGLFDRTEVDMRLSSLLVEAKLTEADFQTKAADVVEGYRDFHEVFDAERLPVRLSRPRVLPEHAEDELFVPQSPIGTSMYLSYQLIRNVLAAQAAGARFCVLMDERRPDLKQAWYEVMSAVRSHELRVRCMVLTWQELAADLPPRLQKFLGEKYGIGKLG